MKLLFVNIEGCFMTKAFWHEQGRYGISRIGHTSGRDFDGRRRPCDLLAGRRSRCVCDSRVVQANRRAEDGRARSLARYAGNALGVEATVFEALDIAGRPYVWTRPDHVVPRDAEMLLFDQLLAE